jgi:hypothetical protein
VRFPQYADFDVDRFGRDRRGEKHEKEGGDQAFHIA